MKNLYHKVLLFSVLALVAFEPQKLQATSSSSSSEEIQNSQKPVKSLTSESFDLIQDTLQKIKNCQYVPDSSFRRLTNTSFEDTSLEELKQLTSTMTPDHDMFDAWIRLILETFPEHPDFEDVLKVTKLKGESEVATPMAQCNLGTMYKFGYSVGRDLLKAFEYYKKAADQGYAEAQFELGAITECGCRDVIDKNLIKAFEYHEKAADQGHPMSQYYLGLQYQNGQGVDKDLIKAFQLFQKAADQEFAPAQCILGRMYQNGEGVDIDLAQFLKWYLESSKNKYKIHDFKIDLKSLITFVPSVITTTDEVNLTNNQETLKNDIEDLLYLHGLEKVINTSYESKKGTNELIFEEGRLAIPSLVEKYQKIIDFEEILLKSILASDQPGFMVTCLQPKDIDAFKSSKCPDIKYYELKSKSFLTFGQNNINAADKLMTIFDTAHPVYGAISDILGVLTEIHTNYHTKIQMSDLARTLKKQHISRLKLSPEDAISLAGRKKLIESVENEITALRQLQAIPQQLQDLLIEGAPVRNRLFLQKNDYI